MKATILKVGGSLLWDPRKNVPNLKNMKAVIDFVNSHKEMKFVIVPGGGYINNVCNEVAKQLNPGVNDDDLDWIGIRSIMIIAETLAAGLGKHHQLLDHEPTDQEVVNFLRGDENVVICPADKPGGSSNWHSVKCAIRFNTEGVINVGVRGLYTSDPDKNEKAQLIKKISWDELSAIIPDRKPRMNFPFDPEASALARKSGLWVKLLEGFQDIENAIKGNDFHGTLISGGRGRRILAIPRKRKSDDELIWKI